MGDLLETIVNKQQRPKAPYTTVAAMTSRPPPVPEKDYYSTRSVPASHGVPAPAPRAGPGRPAKRPRYAEASRSQEAHFLLGHITNSAGSDEISGVDKENHDITIDNPKKRARGGAAAGYGPDPSKVLSPTSSNSRMNARERPAPPPPKSLIARPVSPVKQASASNLLTSMVEKARSTRGTATRKATTSSTASSAAGGAGTTTRARRGAATRNASATPAASHTRTAATTRIARRVSGVSESSDGSTSTVVRKTGARAAGGAATAARAAAAAALAPPPSAKRTVMSTLKKGVTSAAARKAAASKTAQPAAPTTTRSGRVLRKRE